MSPQLRQQRNSLRANLLELTEICPVDQCNPADCPLSALRKLKPGARLRWFHALDEADLRYLAAYHYVCANLKIPPPRPATETATASLPSMTLQKISINAAVGLSATLKRG